MSPQPLVWTSAIDTTGTQTFCGECGHPMHWHECGAGVALTSGPCRCRNDTYSLLDPDPLDATEQERARSDFLHPEPELHPVRGCSVISWLLLSWAVAALLLIAVVVAIATPSEGSVVTGVPHLAASLAPTLRGAPHSPGGTHSAGVRGQSADVWYPRPAGIPGGAPPLSAFYASLAADAYRPRIDTLTGTAADVTRQGDWSYADRSYGPGYLAIPEGPGWLIRACGPAACLERVSTDAGPVKSLQRAGRLGDLSARDWQAICGVELRLGLCPGSLTLLQRPHLPETDR